jgi:transcriptional regulator with XRE-family HTH domain
MSKLRKVGLSRYVDRIMKEKHLSRADVKLRSGGEITDSYVSAIISGAATNLSVGKLKALARGLRVSERKLVSVAFGHPDQSESDRTVDQSHSMILLDIRNKSTIGSDVAEIVQAVVKMPATDRAVVLRYVKRMSRAKRKPQRRGRSG